MTLNKKAESIASRCLVEPTKWYFERFLINASMPGRSDLERMYCLYIVEPTEGSLGFAFDQLNRSRGCMQIHRVIRMALEMACEIESINWYIYHVDEMARKPPCYVWGYWSTSTRPTRPMDSQWVTSTCLWAGMALVGGWPMGRLLTSPWRTYLLYNILATYRSHNTMCSD